MRSQRNAARKVSVRQRPCGTLATRRLPGGTASVPAGHVGLGPSLVDEDQAPRVKSALMLLPPGSPPSHVGAILLAGVQAFFERDPLAGGGARDVSCIRAGPPPNAPLLFVMSGVDPAGCLIAAKPRGVDFGEMRPPDVLP
jgi:hypothetical protein